MPAALGIGLVGTTADFVSWRQPNPLSYRVRIRENLRNQAPIGEVRLAVAVLQRRAGARQQAGEPRLAFGQLPRGEILAIEIEKIEQKEHEAGGVAGV